MKCIRNRNGKVETAVMRYDHPARHPITVVGTMHIGEPDYYDRLLKFIRSNEEYGHEVQFESIRRVSDEEMERVEKTDPDLVAAAKRMRGAFSHRLLADLVGLSTQGVWQSQTVGWTNADVDELTLCRVLTPSYMNEWAEQMEKLAKSLGEQDDDSRKVFRSIIVWMLKHMWFMNLVGKIPRAGFKLNKKIILDWRNEKAVKMATSTDNPVVMIWGAGHLPGIHDMLIAMGYTFLDQSWFATSVEID